MSTTRDILVTRPWRMTRLLQRRGSHAAEFAAAVLARHGRGIITLFAQERVMRRPAAHPVTVQHFHQGGGITVLPQFAIRLSPAVSMQAAAAASQPWQPVAAAGAAPAERVVTRQALVQRLLARERRVQTTTTMREVLRDIVASPPAREGFAGRPLPVRAKPVEMVVHRARAPIAAPPPARGMATASFDAVERIAPPPASHAGSGGTALPLSAVELGRVTDHVVRAIDHRVVALRERHGRI